MSDPGAQEYAIDVRNLTKIYDGRPAVDHISLHVPRGRIYGFLGANGSGKTTTIRMLCGLLTPDDGEGTCLGHDLRREADSIKRRVGYMTQRFSYWEDLTIRENMEFVAEMYSLDRARERIDDVLGHMGLTERADQLAGTLSGGWKQRLALGACTLHDPDLLLLDEPTAGVDPKARREFWDEIHRLATRGITVLVSTHYMDEAERCHAIIYMSKGRLITQGTVQDVVDHAHLNTWVAQGGNLVALMDRLKQEPAVSTVAPFGNVLRISGPDGAALERAIAPLRAAGGYSWEQSKPTLEDVFIYYITAKSEAAEAEGGNGHA